MGRSPCCEKVGLKKGPWTPEEDQKLLAYIQEHGHGSWRALPSIAGLQRCGKSCRLRWTNYLRPDIKRGKFTLQEEQTIIQLHALLGNRWSAIATHLSKRTDNEIKNYWNTHLKKRLAKMGIDPVTHKPKSDSLLSTNDETGQSKSAAKLSHLAQWESARLEAEARLVRESKLRLRQESRSSSTFTGHGTTKTLTGLESPSSIASDSSNLHLHGMVKEEGDQGGNTWKNSSNPNFKAAATAAMELQGDNNNNNYDSLSSALLFHQDQSLSARVSSIEEEGGFTELLLNSGGDRSLSDSNSENNDGVSNEGYYEDSKNYWNSILSLVDSSPSESPMF